jgi:hypothetical protein
MGWGTGNLGGGSGGLNFKVVSYPTEEELIADAPAENTIGVVTTTPITARVFSATDPQSLLDGAVWFLIGTNSPAAFNAMKAKKDAVMVYPMSAKQSVDGVLVDVVAKSYIGGAWVDWWNGELYDAGNEFESVTGGWVEYSGNTAGATIEYGTGYLKLTTGKHGVVTSIETGNLIDMTDYSALVLTGEIKSATTSGGWGLRDANGDQVAFTTSEYSIDISTLNGLYKPFLQVKNGPTYEYITMNKMQMTR